MQLVEARDLAGDLTRDLGLRLRARHREQLRRRSDDPLGLARQLQGIERGRHPLLGDPPEHPAHFGERVHRRGRGDQGERADAQEGQQQPAAHAHPPQHGST